MPNSVIKNPRRIMSLAGGASDPRVDILANNEYKVLYWAQVGATSGTITIPTGATVLLDQLQGGVDAYPSTISSGQPTGDYPQTSGAAVVTVTSFDASGNYTLSGTPSAFPVAIIYLLKISALNWSNLTTANILEDEDYNLFLNKLQVGTDAYTSAFNLNSIIANNTTATTGLGVFNSNTSGYSAVTLGQSNAGSSFIARTGSAKAGNYTGTSVPLASTLQFINGNSDTPILIAGTPIINTIGTTSTNYGTRLDATGFRIGQLSGLHTSNTEVFSTGSVHASSSVISINAATSAGYSGSVYGGYNFRTTTTNQRVLVGEDSGVYTGLAVIEARGYAASAGSRTTYQLITFGTTALGNYTGTSIPLASTFANSYSQSDYSSNFLIAGTGAVTNIAATHISLAGSTSTNYGTRLDSVGLRVGVLSTLHTANTKEFEVAGLIKMGDGASVVANTGAVWLGNITPSASNYSIVGNGTTLRLNSTSNVSTYVNGTIVVDVNANNISFAPTGNSFNVDDVFLFRPATATTATTTAERRAFHINMGSNGAHHAAGTIATNRDVLITARSHSFTSASTITDAATLAITAAPIAGTNATITNAYSLWSQAGKVRMQGLPTSSAGLQAGDLWVDTGAGNVVKIV